jgi:MOSC domain-containing protein YiiM
MDIGTQGRVVAVAADGTHRFSKVPRGAIRLLAGLGVEGDAHAGETVKHRSRVAVDPTQPNLRQVHLTHSELLDELAQRGFNVAPGDLGENLLTAGVDLLALPRGSLLHIGDSAVVEVTGLRNPCSQIEAFQPGLLAAVLEHRPDGSLWRKAGIMGVVRETGMVAAGDSLRIHLPAEPHLALERV